MVLLDCKRETAGRLKKKRKDGEKYETERSKRINEGF
jgi:hypothetical protein